MFPRSRRLSRARPPWPAARSTAGWADDYDAISVGLGALDADGRDEMMMGCTNGDHSGVAGLGTVNFFAGG